MGSGYGYLDGGTCKFDGSNDYIDTANIATTINPASTAVTLATRVLSPASLSDYQVIVSASNSGSTSDGFYYLMFMADGSLLMHNGKGPTYATIQSAASTISTSTWYTIHVTLDNATVKIYVDGNEVSYGTQDSLTETFTTARFVLGAYSIDYNYWCEHSFRWSALYDAVRSGTNISDDHNNADTFYNLLGYSDNPGVDEVFDSLVAPSSGVAPQAMNHRKNQKEA
jgi:hypothetical protein